MIRPSAKRRSVEGCAALVQQHLSGAGLGRRRDDYVPVGRRRGAARAAGSPRDSGGWATPGRPAARPKCSSPATTMSLLINSRSSGLSASMRLCSIQAPCVPVPLLLTAAHTCRVTLSARLTTLLTRMGVHPSIRRVVSMCWSLVMEQPPAAFRAGLTGREQIYRALNRAAVSWGNAS
jgi:hypothetical protein